MTPDNEWSTIDTSQSQNKEEDKVEFEIEGQEEVVEEKPQQPEVETKPETEDVKPEKKPEINSSGAEKRIRQLVRQKKEREEQIDQLIAKQAELEEKLKAQQKNAETSFTKNFETTEEQIKSRIEMAKDVYKQAIESGDSGLIVNAQESLNNAQNDANALKIAKQQYESQRPVITEENQKVAPVQQQPQQNVKYDKLALEWAGKNSWFGKDQVMTTLALELDQTLKGEGYDPSEEDFYNEIDNRLRQQYPDRFGVDTRQQETTSPAQVVGGASRTPSSSKGKKVKLSKEDMRLAEKWGIPLEQYAAEKLKVEKSEGDYTTVYNR